MRTDLIYKTLFVLCLSVAGHKSAAQFFDDDARVWMNLNLVKEGKNGMEYQLLFQNRLNNNMSQYNGYCSAAIAYKINKHFRLIGGYVAGGKREIDGNYSLIQQAFGGLMLRQKLGRFTLVYRNLTQTQAKGSMPLDGEKTPTTFNRNKATVRYELNKRWQFYISGELYFTLTNRYKYQDLGKTRYVGGLLYRLSKSSSLEPYFLYQKKNDYKGRSSRNFIYGITFNKDF